MGAKIEIPGNKRSSCYSNRSNNSSHSESIDRSSGREIVESKHVITVIHCSNCHRPKFIILGTNSEKRLSITSGKVQLFLPRIFDLREFELILSRWRYNCELERINQSENSYRVII